MNTLTIRRLRLMMEYLKRKIRTKKISIPENYDMVQVAFNSWGHLTIRTFSSENPDEDILIVFDRDTTYKIMNFLRRISNY